MVLFESEKLETIVSMLKYLRDAQTIFQIAVTLLVVSDQSSQLQAYAGFFSKVAIALLVAVFICGCRTEPWHLYLMVSSLLHCLLHLFTKPPVCLTCGLEVLCVAALVVWMWILLLRLLLTATFGNSASRHIAWHAVDALLVFAGQAFASLRFPVSQLWLLGGLLVLFASDAALVLTLERRAARAWRENQLLREQCEQAKEKLGSTVNMLKFLSHEVRNPQQAISLSAESLMLEAEAQPELFQPTHLRLFAIIRSSSEFVTALLEDVLNFLRMADNKITLDLRAFDVNDFVTQVCRSLESVLVTRELGLQMRFDTLLPAMILGDRHRIRQVLANFVSNSAKFSTAGDMITVMTQLLRWPELPGDVALTELSEGIADGDSSLNLGMSPLVSTQVDSSLTGSVAEDKRPVFVRFSVIDTGIGISSENQLLLFKPFSQINASETQSGKGMGLGLNICKGLAELHGGHIGVKSQVGKGAEFYFDIPLMLVPAEVDADVATLQPLSGLTGNNVDVAPVVTVSNIVLESVMPLASVDAVDIISPSCASFVAETSFGVNEVSVTALWPQHDATLADVINISSLHVIPSGRAPIVRIPANIRLMAPPLARPAGSLRDIAIELCVPESIAIHETAVSDGVVILVSPDTLPTPPLEIASSNANSSTELSTHHTSAHILADERGSVIATSSCPLSTLATSGCGLLCDIRPASSSVSSRSTVTVPESPAVPCPMYCQVPSQTHLPVGLSTLRAGHVSTWGVTQALPAKNGKVAEKSEFNPPSAVSLLLSQRVPRIDVSTPMAVTAATVICSPLSLGASNGGTHRFRTYIIAESPLKRSSLSGRCADGSLSCNVVQSAYFGQLSQCPPSLAHVDHDEILSQRTFLFSPNHTLPPSLSDMNLLPELPSLLSQDSGFIAKVQHRAISRALDATGPSFDSPVLDCLTPHGNHPSAALARVLIADDSKMVHIVMSRLLSQLGFDFAVVSDGSEAVLALSVEGHGFDLAIFDFMMPHMNGVQAIATLRARGCRVPFLGLTGSDSAVHADAFIRAGAQHVMVKPVKGAQLKHVLLQLLHNNKQ